MNKLKYADLERVKPEFKDIAKQSLDRGEAVPREIINLCSPGNLSEIEISQINELNKKYKLES
jgi:hypothetical protein